MTFHNLSESGNILTTNAYHQSRKMFYLAFVFLSGEKWLPREAVSAPSLEVFKKGENTPSACHAKDILF